MASGCVLEKDAYEPYYAPLKRNNTGESILKEIFEELGLDIEYYGKRFASTDAGNVSW